MCSASAASVLVVCILATVRLPLPHVRVAGRVSRGHLLLFQPPVLRARARWRVRCRLRAPGFEERRWWRFSAHVRTLLPPSVASEALRRGQVLECQSTCQFAALASRFRNLDNMVVRSSFLALEPSLLAFDTAPLSDLVYAWERWRPVHLRPAWQVQVAEQVCAVQVHSV